VSMKTFYRRRIGDILVHARLVAPDQLEWALEQQQQSGKRLGEVLVDAGYVSEDDIAEARALQVDIPYISLSGLDIDPDIVKLVPEKIARDFRLVSVSQSNGRVALAMTNPLDVEAIDRIRRLTQKRVEPLLASELRISQVLDNVYGSGDTGGLMESLQQAASDVDVDTSSGEDDDFEATDVDEVRRQSDQAPVVKTVNLIIKEAVKRRASDIHLEPRKGHVEIRYRVDGALQHVRKMPKSLQAAVISRIKIMAELDIAERRIPQDGRIAVRVEGRNIDLRVSTLPIQYGERVVMRILDKNVALKNLDELGFAQRDRSIFESLIKKPYGIILVTGPTGSGKTTTLYTALSFLKSIDVNIMTCEDPIEYELEGINQSAINVKAGITFASQLRAILRQDPDIVLIGEIRDTETAEIAFQAALTGHLVLATLHCNDAPSAITRLIDMGMEPFLVSSSVIGVVAQRLTRIICPRCKVSYDASDAEIHLLNLPTDKGRPALHRGNGCSRCSETGYQGRVGVFEVMVMDEAMRREMLGKPSSDAVRQLAYKAGMTSMREDATNKMLEGITTIEEVKKRVFVDGDVAEQI